MLRLIHLDGEGLPSEPTVRTFLKALAQRGARASSHASGAVVEARRAGRWTAIGWLGNGELAALERLKWLAPGVRAGEWQLSGAGRTIVRLMKAGPAPSETAVQATIDAPQPCPPQPKADPESPLAWLRSRRDRNGAPLLSEQAHAAGERLRVEFARAHLMPRVTTDWDAIPRSRDEQQGLGQAARERSGTAADAAERVRKALASLPPELAGLAFDVCCLEQRLPDAERQHGAPQRSGHYLLSIALTALARHYGLLPPANSAWSSQPRIRHWGGDGYRPTIDGASDLVRN